MNNSSVSIPRPALILGLGGLLPFLVSAIAVIILDGNGLSGGGLSNEFALHALGAYGAVILSFLGGVHWGRLLHDEVKINQWGPLTLSVVPSLIAWPALLLGTTAMLILLIAGFSLQYVLDRAAVERDELPAWFGRLRLMLTSGAVLSLSGALLAVLLG